MGKIFYIFDEEIRDSYKEFEFREHELYQVDSLSRNT